MLNPFKALGDMNAMRKHAMEIQKALEAEEYEVVVNNVRVVISGNQNVRLIETNGGSDEDVKRAVNDAIKKSQQAAAMKLSEISKNFQ